jgi:hypothetical protein
MYVGSEESAKLITGNEKFESYVVIIKVLW